MDDKLEKAEGFVVGADKLQESVQYMREGKVASLLEFMTPDAVDRIVAAYNTLGAALSKATYEGSAIIRTPENADFVMAREVPWEELPPDVKRAWARAGLEAGFVFKDLHGQVMDAIRAGTRRKARALGELPPAESE